jgi:hypothetical protein
MWVSSKSVGLVRKFQVLGATASKKNHSMSACKLKDMNMLVGV